MSVYSTVSKIDDTVCCYKSGIINKQKHDEILGKLLESELVKKCQENWDLAIDLLNQMQVHYETQGSIIISRGFYVYKILVSALGFCLLKLKRDNTEIGRKVLMRDRFDKSLKKELRW